jgi:hypothetical protein
MGKEGILKVQNQQGQRQNGLEPSQPRRQWNGSIEEVGYSFNPRIVFPCLGNLPDFMKKSDKVLDLFFWSF